MKTGNAYKRQLKEIWRENAYTASETKGDVWAAGIILFYVVTQEKFHKSSSTKASKIAQKDVNKRFAKVKAKHPANESLLHLCYSMLTVNVKKRPSAKDCQTQFEQLFVTAPSPKGEGF